MEDGKKGMPRMGLAGNPHRHLLQQLQGGGRNNTDFLNNTERSSLGLLPAQALQESLNLGSDETPRKGFNNKENDGGNPAGEVTSELPSRYFKPSSAVKPQPTPGGPGIRTVNNNEGGDDFNWNSLLNSDSFRSFQQHGMSQLPNLTNAEMSFHPGAISASSTMSQTRLIDSRDAEEDFRDEGLSQGEQFGDAADNLRLINDAEKVFEEEHAFEAPEEIPPFPSHQASANLEKTRDSAQPGGSGEADSTLSMSDYFAIRTSAIGSLEKDLDKIGGMPRRPDFGFDGGAPRSPTRVPCRIVRNEDTFQADPCASGRAPVGKTTTSLPAAPTSKLSDSGPSKIRPGTTEFLPSFMEMTTTDDATFLKPSPPAPLSQANKPSPSKIPLPSFGRGRSPSPTGKAAMARPTTSTTPSIQHQPMRSRSVQPGNSSSGVFKAPMPPGPPLASKSKSVRAPGLNSTSAAAAPIRHSSPIKIDRAKSEAAATGAASSGFQFPITSDRNALLWLGVAPGGSEERCLNLRNVWGKPLSASLMVRTSGTPAVTSAEGGSSSGKGFVIGTTDGLQVKENLLPGSSTPCAIRYKCPPEETPGTWSEAKFVIKPHDLGIGKALKATISLHALNGKPLITVEGLTSDPSPQPLANCPTTLALGQIPNNASKEVQLTFHNGGTAHAFVCLKSYLDPEMKKAMSDGSILIQPSHLVLGPSGGRQKVTLRVDPSVVSGSDGDEDTSSYVATLAIVSGPEAARKVLVKCNAGNGSKLNAIGITADDLKKSPSPAAAVKVPAGVSLSSAGVEDVAGYFSCQKIQLFGSKSEFQQLNYEETLSETRLNCTADLAAPSYHTMKPSYTDAGVPRTTGKMSGHMPTINEEKERCKTLPTKAGSVGQGAARRMAAATAPVTSTTRKIPQPFQLPAPPSSVEKTKTRCVSLESEKVIFPNVTVGKSITAKIKIKNPTSKTIIMAAHIQGQEGGPFYIQESSVEVKPKMFRSLTCTFTPTTKGRFEGRINLVAINEEGLTLSAVLKGATS